MVFEMEVEERSMVRAILEDVKSLKGKVEGMEGMLETRYIRMCFTRSKRIIG
jgi:hypothetical protein